MPTSVVVKVHFPHLRRCGDSVCFPGGFCRVDNVSSKPTLVESPGGLSPPGAPKTVCHGIGPSAQRGAGSPDESGRYLTHPAGVPPVPCAFGLMAHLLELASCPSNDIGIDPFEGRTQLRLVEVAVVGDPAADARVVHRGQLSQGQVTAMVTISLRNFNPSHRRRKVTP